MAACNGLIPFPSTDFPHYVWRCKQMWLWIIINSQFMETIVTELIIHICQTLFHTILLTKLMLKMYKLIEILPSVPKKLIIQEHSL